MAGSSKRSKRNNAAPNFYNPNVQSIINRFFQPLQTASHQQERVQVDQSNAVPNEPPTANEDMQVNQATPMCSGSPVCDLSTAVPSCPAPHVNSTDIPTSISVFPCFPEHTMEVITNSSPSTPLRGICSIMPTSSSLAPMDIATHELALSSSACVLPQKRRSSLINSSVAIGQDEAFAKVCEYLRNDDIGIIGIYGMGGVGKTTLMRKVCYEFLKPYHFNVIWTTVSKNVDVNGIQKCIMRELKLSYYEDEDPQTRAMKINEALFNSKDKLVALLLDDIWEYINLEVLGAGGGCGLDTSRFKIIFTTRSKDVCLGMDPDEEMKMECLGWEESWALFEQSVGDKTLNANYKILELGKEVAKECAGLPLALTVIGKAMVCKTSVEAWEDALKNLRECPSLVSGADKNLFQRLKFSYDNLENQVERDCFLFCCMYPEDREIDKYILVESWIGEDLLDASRGTYQDTCNRGLGIIDTLVAKSLLKVVEDYSSTTYVKMHDVIRDMGLWIGSESNFFVHTNRMKLRGEERLKRWNRARRVYVETDNHDLLEELDCSYLLTLHFTNIESSITISNLFLKSMNCMHSIKVLVLHSVAFECPKIPASTLGLLIELRYLEIAWSNLRALPADIGNLTKLLVLKLMHNDKLTTFPTTIGGLCELRKLKMHNTFFTAIPSELGKLKKLEIVEIFLVNRVILHGIFNCWTELRRLDLNVKSPTMLPKDMMRLNKLEELRIEIMQSYSAPEDTLLIKGLKELTSLKLLQLDGWSIAHGDEVIFALETLHQLRELHIIRCPTDKFVMTATAHFLPQLKVLRFIDCPRLGKVHFGKGALQSLCILEVGICHCLETIVGLQRLQQLRKLSIYNSGGALVDGLVTADDDDDGHGLVSDVQTCVCFPNLQLLKLGNMRKMKRICDDNVSFPSLSYFSLFKCPMLEKLPRGLMNGNRAPISGEIEGTETWWEGLGWEDDDFKLSLRPLFLVEVERCCLPLPKVKTWTLEFLDMQTPPKRKNL